MQAINNITKHDIPLILFILFISLFPVQLYSYKNANNLSVVFFNIPKANIIHFSLNMKLKTMPTLEKNP